MGPLKTLLLFITILFFLGSLGNVGAVDMDLADQASINAIWETFTSPPTNILNPTVCLQSSIIRCTEDGKVTDLKLLGAKGSLATEIAALTALTYLQLQYFNLSSPLPTELGTLPALKTLSMHGTIPGPIPTEIGSLTSLNHFYLNIAGLSSPLPIELWSLPALKSLALKGTIHGSIPTEIGSLTSLNSLNFDALTFTGDPTANTIPTEIGQLSSLLSMNWYSIKGLSGVIPTEVGKLSQLTSLSFKSIADLVGTIPTEIGMLSQLKFMRFGFLPGLGGSIPTEIGMLSQLTHMAIDNMPGLNGTIPTEIGMLFKLVSILLRTLAGLKGPIPTEIGKLSQLRFPLVQNAPGLNGTIPTEIGKLSQLYSLELQQLPSLGGTLPTEIGALTKLEELIIQSTSVGGPIPSQLNYLQMVARVFLDNNQLTGTIPTELDDIFSLEFLYLAGNQLCYGVDYSGWAQIRTDFEFITKCANCEPVCQNGGICVLGTPHSCDCAATPFPSEPFCAGCPAQSYDHIEWEATQAGDMANALSCLAGFDLSGTLTRKCQLNGQWSSKISNRCLTRKCAADEEDGISWPTTIAGRRATAACPGGGSGRKVHRWCEYSGEWADPISFC